MKITKHLHSCLSVEENGTTLLFDPGIYTYQDKGLAIDSLKQLDYLLITHEHHDHMFVPFVKEIVAKFPKVQIISNTSVQTILASYNIHVATEGNEIVSFEDAPHEHVFGQSPKNISITILGKLTHPGDSMRFTKTAEILALPIQSPWGSYVQALEKAKEIKPKVVIPIHDWHWKDEARNQFYQRATEYLKEFGIEFKSMETNVTIDL